MNKKFRRTRSVEPSLQLSKRNLSTTQDVNQLSQNTIIPYINQRYFLIPKKQTNNISEKVIQIKTDKSTKLSCLVVVNRLQKYVLFNAGLKIFMFLKGSYFQQKLNIFIKSIEKLSKKKAFSKIKSKSYYLKSPQKLIFLHFINKRLQHNDLSFAFRKLILFDNLNKQQKLIKTKLKHIKKQQVENSIGQDSQQTIKVSYSSEFLHNYAKKINKINETRSMYKLKPDSYRKKDGKLSNIWMLPVKQFSYR